MKTRIWNPLNLILSLSFVAVTGCDKEPSRPAQPESTAAGSEMMGQGMHEGQGMGMKGMHPTNGGAPSTMGGGMMGGSMMDQMRASCPMVVEDADVEVSNSDKGVTLTFTTQKGDVADLKTRVEHLAQMYGMQDGHGSMMWHQMGSGHMGSGNAMGGAEMMGKAGAGAGGAGAMHGEDMGSMPAADATVKSVDKAVQLTLVPKDSSQLDALRVHARAHQQRMHAGECWMANPPSAAQGKQ
jgi:hypothetical protein